MKLGGYLIFIFGISLACMLLGMPTMYTQFSEKGQATGLVGFTGGGNCTAAQTTAANQLGVFNSDTNPCSQANVKTDSGGSNVTNIIVILLMVTIAGIAVGFVSGFSAIYIIAAVIFVSILGFFVLPLPSLVNLISTGTDGWFAYPVLLFLNIITVGAVVSFVRGDF